MTQADAGEGERDAAALEGAGEEGMPSDAPRLMGVLVEQGQVGADLGRIGRQQQDLGAVS